MAENLVDNASQVLEPELISELDKLALACRILEAQGHGSRTLGHGALRDPDGKGFWIKRWGIAFDEVQDWHDFILLGFDGRQLFGDGKRHSEWPIHAEILKRRPDFNVSFHSHPFYGRVFSAAEEPLQAVSNPGNYFKAPPPRYTGTSELVRKVSVATEVAECMDGHDAIFLRNHGVVFCGETIARALIVGVQLEEACKEQLTIQASGIPWSWPDDEERARKKGDGASTESVELYFDYFARRLGK